MLEGTKRVLVHTVTLNLTDTDWNVGTLWPKTNFAQATTYRVFQVLRFECLGSLGLTPRGTCNHTQKNWNPTPDEKPMHRSRMWHNWVLKCFTQPRDRQYAVAMATQIQPDKNREKA